MSQLDDNNHQVVHSVDKTLKLKKKQICKSAKIVFELTSNFRNVPS